ncbi:retrotransposon ty3-gypsy subclass [Cystoisospora suis]|uniref:Retrotransposon ty3-gypsy subclass n=1 Tax=Cystoisospora suis TaxID=483139 RepID=A0A2C6L4T0_9APIC|nr:retrotransposon ty3-gypsy subclass [Cystoisospora suis]
MLFGLAGAPSTFQRLMQNVFINELDEYLIVYHDDELIYSRTKDEHLNHLTKVLRRIREHQLYVGINKCEFVVQKVKYLGYIIQKGSIPPDLRKVEALKNYPEKLGNVRQVRGFLGLVGSYLQLIKDFNKKAKPLHDLLSEKSATIWRPKHSQAVTELKDARVNVAMTKIFNPDLPIVINTDASKPDYIEKVMTLRETSQRRGRDLAYERRTKLIGWGKGYDVCDDFRKRVTTCKALGIDENTWKYISLIEGRKEYQWDENLLWVKTREGWKLCVLSKDKRREVLHGFHDHPLAGHPGTKKTTQDVEKIFWSPTLKADVEKYVKSCSACALGKASYAKYGGLLNPLHVPNYPWEVINVDLIMGLPKGKDGYDAIVTFVCQLTKMAHFIPVKQTINAIELGHVLVREAI